MDGDQDIGLSERMTDSLSGPARVGAELRKRRERLGWSTAEVASRLKIRPGFLQAIEEGDLAALPAPAYAAGFIRSYAEALSLDPGEVLRSFRAEGLTRKGTPLLGFPEVAPDRGVPPGAVALLVGVLAVGAYALWYYESAHTRHAEDLVPAVPANLVALTLPKPPPMPRGAAVSVNPVPKPAGRSSTAAPVVIPPPPPSPEAEIKTAPLPPPPEAEIETAPLPPPAPAPVVQETEPPLPLPLPLPPAPPPAKALAAARLALAPPAIASHAGKTASQTPEQILAKPPRLNSTAPAPAPSNNIVLIATSRTWVQIRNLHGKILFSRVMLPGESWPLPDQPGLTLTTGNAGGTALIRNGVPGPPLGPSGSVVHDVLITPSGTIVPPLPSPSRRQSGRHRQSLEGDPVNPFAISTKGDQ